MFTALLWLSYLQILWPTGHGFPGQNTPPVFDFKREWLIPESEPVGSRIVTVRTHDDERDPIEYGIEPAVFLDGSSFFRINKKTGEVFLANSMTGQVGNDYYLFITANDGHQTAKIEVYVRVLEPNGSPREPAIDIPFSTSRPPSSIGSRFRPFPPFSRPNPPYLPAAPDAAAPSSAGRPSFKKNPFPATYSSTSAPSTDSASSTTSTISGEGPTTSKGLPAVENGEYPDSKDRRRFDVTATVFPVIATIAFAPVVGVVFWLLHKRCRREEKIITDKKLTDRRESDLSDDLDINVHPSVMYLQRPRRALSNRYESKEFLGVIPEDKKWEFLRHHLRFIGILGEGCFGQVWKCEALNICNTEGTSLVAVKTLKENATEKEKKDLLSELEVMKLLEPHQNVVTLLGSCTERDPIFVIMEYIPYGKLQTYLRESRAERFYGNLHGSSRNLTSRDLTSFAYQVAKGMEYLSSKGIIHRDLAARNILVGENKMCKVADFGFARDVIVNHVYERKSEGRLPIRWMAPESLYDNIFTTKTDVWSFGILMWEIVTLGSTPYPGMSAPEVMRRVRDGYRLEKPEHCKREMYNIMFYCWDTNPTARPSFAELVRLLDKLLISENDYIELDRFPDHSYYNITNLSGEKL